MTFQKKLVKKKRNTVKVPYSPGKVKARNLLNISYRRGKKQDFTNFAFIVEIYKYQYLIKDFNPLFLDVKLNKDSDREMVKMLQEYSMPKSLHEYIKLSENFEKFCDSKNSIKKPIKGTCQYIYLRLFPKYYVQNNKFGI